MQIPQGNTDNVHEKIEYFKVYYDIDAKKETDAYPKKEFLFQVIINLTIGIIIRNAKKIKFHTPKIRVFSSLSNVSFLISIGLIVSNIVLIGSPILWIVAGLCALVALFLAFYAANDIIQMKSEYYGYTTNKSLPTCKYEKLDKNTVINIPSKYKEIKIPKGAIDDINNNIKLFYK